MPSSPLPAAGAQRLAGDNAYEIGALLLLVLAVLLVAVRPALSPPGQRSWRSIRSRSVTRPSWCLCRARRCRLRLHQLVTDGIGYGSLPL